MDRTAFEQHGDMVRAKRFLALVSEAFVDATGKVPAEITALEKQADKMIADGLPHVQAHDKQQGDAFKRAGINAPVGTGGGISQSGSAP